MLTNNLGFPRMGSHRQLKRSCEQYWAGLISRQELFLVAKKIQEDNWMLQSAAGIDLIPCNDFSFYDQVLDMSLLLGVIPNRYAPVVTEVKDNTEIDLYFAMARGYQRNGLDITAMEMTKWFDTNYHYIVPEFTPGQEFKVFSNRLFSEFSGAKHITGKTPKPVLIGPVSYLLLGKEKPGEANAGFDKIDLIKKLVPVYIEILNKLKDDYRADWVQLDEPFLVIDLTEKQKQAYIYAYGEIKKHCPHIKILLTT
jgi:5-methyltetrahydropteroyltriglutamate--homocysteine methyltransferase